MTVAALIAGIDEAGRGALAGPVVAGACILPCPVFRRRHSLPRWSPFNLYEISSWSRAIVVPLALVRSFRPVCPVPEGRGIEELFVGDRSEAALRLPRAPKRFCWRNFFLRIDDLLQVAEARPAGRLRARARRAAEAWMLERFERSGGLGAIFPPMVYALMALRLLGYPDDHPQVVRARLGG